MGRIGLPARTSKPCLLPPRRLWLLPPLARREQEASSCPPRSPRLRSPRPRRPRSLLPRRLRSRQRRPPSQRLPRSPQPRRRQRSQPRRPPPRRSRSSHSNLIVHHYSFFYLSINHHGLH